jgi:hypothetical protein
VVKWLRLSITEKSEVKTDRRVRQKIDSVAQIGIVSSFQNSRDALGVALSILCSLKTTPVSGASFVPLVSVVGTGWQPQMAPRASDGPFIVQCDFTH